MMKIKITIAFLFVSILSNAQDILSLEQAAYYSDNELDLPQEVTKIHDLNNTLDSFVGNWTGIYNGNTIVFRIYKARVYNSYSNIEEDFINIKYDIKDSNGNIVVSSAQSGLSEFHGILYHLDGYFGLNLHDACGNTRKIYVKPEVPQQNWSVVGAAKTELQVVITQGSPQGITSDPLPNNSQCTSTADYLPNGAMLILNKV
ncbi:hypothetical protein BBFL7_01493 [Flavobacteria bacterium BBFL7]|nr:hypothetical protein BBFL7_01493 [Flavobacteria bacterium BBFL7]